MRLLIANKQGLNDHGKLDAAIGQARSFDIAMFQETKLKLTKLNPIRAKWGHDAVYMSACPGQVARRGVLTLFSPRIDVKHINTTADDQGQFLINVFVFYDKFYLLVNYYGDPDTDAHALLTVQRLEQSINDTKQHYHIDEIIIGGDFNFVTSPNDSTSVTVRRNTEAYWDGLVNNELLFDPEELFHATPRHTYFRHRHNNTSARYDRYYVTQDLLTGAEINVLPRIGDHAPVELRILQTERGERDWRMDDTLLSRVACIETIQGTLARILRNTVGDNDEELPINQLQYCIDYTTTCPLNLLTTLVKTLRRELMRVTKEARSRRRAAVQTLTQNLIDARDQLNNANNQQNLESYEDARDRLRMHQTAKAVTASERNFLRYASAGERVTRYHFSLGNRTRPAREIREIEVPGNPARTISDQELVHYMSQKFGEIAREDNTVGNTPIENFLGPLLADAAIKCPVHLHDLLTSEVCAEELKKVITGMKNESVPGPLGISNRLLKVIFPIIQDILVKAANKLLFSDTPVQRPPWLYHRKVLFVPKPGRDPKSEDSYRGLSMLENIFKAFSGVLAKRLSSVLQHIQDPEQYGFTEDKSCMEPTRTVIDTIKYAVANNQSLVVLSTDFYKAFDTVTISHIERSLDFFQFPEEYKNAFMALAKHGTLQFEINGNLSEDVALNRGTGQGDPKSSGCFNLCITPLNIYLSKSPDVPRFRAGAVEISPVYFADDNALLLDGNNTQGIISTVNKTSQYEDVSGLKLNLSKCEFLAINCPQQTIDQLQGLGMKRVSRLKHLGVIIEESGEVLEEHNFQPIVDKLETIATRFKTSGSTPIGRSLYAKFLLGSRYVHRLQNGSLSAGMMEQITDSLLLMTWTKSRYGEDLPGYRVHIAKARVTQPFRYGGLNLPDPAVQSKSLRLLWLKRFTLEYQSQGWYKLLSLALTRLQRPTPAAHLTLGHREWRKTAQVLRNTSPYWSQVFDVGDELQRLATEQFKLWHMIPIFGTSGQDNIVNLDSLEYANPMARHVMSSSLKVVGQLFNVNNLGIINTRSLKSREEVSRLHANIGPMLWNSMLGLVNEIKRDYRQSINAVRVRMTNQTALESIVFKYSKGCSAANDLLLRAPRLRWPQGEVPPSHRTYTNSGITQISKDSFLDAFTSVYKSEVLPSIKWTSLQVLLRTLWTQVKESNTTRNGNDQCLNCMQQPEHTIHLMHSCVVAQHTLRIIKDAVNSLLNDEIDMTSDLVLFHKVPATVQPQQRQDIIDLLLIYKHVIYRTRFRQNQNRQPTTKLITISIILELEKHILLKNRQCLTAENLICYMHDLRNAINWN